MKKTIACSLLIIISLTNTVVLASEAVNFRVTQANVQLPDITAWIDIADDKGVKLETLKAEQLTATVGTYPATVKEVSPFSKSNAGTAFIFLVDISKSLKPQTFTQLQAALNTWVEGMHEHDKAALISFGSQVKLVQDFSADKSALKQGISKLAPSDKDTFLYQGLVQAMELGRRQDADLPKRHVIVVLTDGINDAAGSVTKEEVFVQIAENRTPIYAIGYAAPPLTKIHEEGFKELGVIARTSGGHFIKADSMPLSEAYTLQKDRIANSYELLLDCAACQSDGQLSRLNITFSAGNRTLNDGLDLRLLPQSKVIPSNKEVDQSATRKIYSQLKNIIDKYPYQSAAAIITLSALIIWALLRLRRKMRLPRYPEDDGDIADKQPEKTIAFASKEAPIREKYRLSLTVVSGAEPGKRFDVCFNDSIILGRSADSNLCLDDSEISSRHAEIKLDKGILGIKDLDSMNGTLINGVPIHTIHYLQDGDQILIGRTELRLNGLVSNHES